MGVGVLLSMRVWSGHAGLRRMLWCALPVQSFMSRGQKHMHCHLLLWSSMRELALEVCTGCTLLEGAEGSWWTRACRPITPEPRPGSALPALPRTGLRA